MPATRKHSKVSSTLSCRRSSNAVTPSKVSPLSIRLYARVICVSLSVPIICLACSMFCIRLSYSDWSIFLHATTSVRRPLWKLRDSNSSNSFYNLKTTKWQKKIRESFFCVQKNSFEIARRKAKKFSAVSALPSFSFAIITNGITNHREIGDVVGGLLCLSFNYQRQNRRIRTFAVQPDIPRRIFHYYWHPLAFCSKYMILTSHLSLLKLYRTNLIYSLHKP